jgi:sulfate adenylyltransferase subunit 1 (EFTu-like GTPase family)
MKNTIIYLVIFSLLLQSCQSYKTIDLKNTELKAGKTYKIKVEGKFATAKLKAISDSTITVVKSGADRYITLSDIKEIKEGEFSILKTIGFIAFLGLAIIIPLAAIGASGTNYSTPIVFY